MVTARYQQRRLLADFIRLWALSIRVEWIIKDRRLFDPWAANRTPSVGSRPSRVPSAPSRRAAGGAVVPDRATSSDRPTDGGWRCSAQYDSRLPSSQIGTIEQTCTVGKPARSNSLTIVAPQRVQVPQVDVRITACTPSLTRDDAIS